jgi:hypothetical protein
MRILIFLLGAMAICAFLVALFFTVCFIYRFFDLDRFFFRKERDERLMEEAQLQRELEVQK